MKTILDIMRTSAVIPVIAIERLEHAVPLAKALVAGGIRVLEVTLRTEHGLPAIRAIAEQVPDAIVGVGTLTSPEEFAASRDAGAVFGVSPGLTPALIAAAKSSGLPLLPGVMTPSEVMAARGPLGDVTFCPTGGISQETAAQFLACKNVACVGGSWLTPKNAIEIGDWGRITELATAASALKLK